jgi:anti-sigma regulatory factor (Ser/Thr protein kinase)
MMLELHATPQEVMRAVQALQQFGQEQQLAEREIFGLALALEECGSNIVDHAYRRDHRQKFHVTIEHSGTALTVELRDRGPEFDPTRAQIAKRSTNSAERPPGGWGLSLARHYADEIQYRREAGENILRLTKRLGPATTHK